MFDLQLDKYEKYFQNKSDFTACDKEYLSMYNWRFTIFQGKIQKSEINKHSFNVRVDFLTCDISQKT